MVKTSGCVIPTSAEMLREYPQNLTMLQEIIHSCWRACVDDDDGTTYHRDTQKDTQKGTGKDGGKDGGKDTPHSKHPATVKSSTGLPLTSTRFRAQVIISNPVTYGHIHCAEALGCPLHLLFPQVTPFIIFTPSIIFTSPILSYILATLSTGASPHSTYS